MLAVLGAAVIPAACREPTQMTLVVSTDVPCAALREVVMVAANESRIAEERVPSGFYAATTNACAAGGHVGTLVLTPAENGRGGVVVVAGVDRAASECKPADGYFGCVVARRSFSFVDHTPLELPVALMLDCKNVPCDAVSTCVRGACVSSDVSCTDTGCAPFGSPPDGGPPALSDAGDGAPGLDGNDLDATSDATSDAPPDAKVDGADGSTTSDGIQCSVNPPFGAAVTCAQGVSCCYGSFGSASCAPTGTCSDNDFRCRGPADCQLGQTCCEIDMVTGGSGTVATACVGGATCAQFRSRACERTADCVGADICKVSYVEYRTCQPP